MSKYIEPPWTENCQWRTDTPKEPGWYPASCGRFPDILRYWNGCYWSEAVSDARNAQYALKSAMLADPCPRSIEWCEPWWPTKKGKA